MNRFPVDFQVGAPPDGLHKMHCQLLDLHVERLNATPVEESAFEESKVCIGGANGRPVAKRSCN